MPLADPKTYGEAVNLLVDRPFLASGKWRAQQTRPVRLGAHPDILRFERAFVARFKRLGIPVFPHSIVRDAATQNRLFVTGVSMAKAGRSPHNHGMAVDLVHSVHAWNVPKASWEVMGHVGLEVAAQLGVELTWGGHWKFWDPAHWELKDWKSLTALAVKPLEASDHARLAGVDHLLK